jgi:MoaA/NifB/PqqE/SkfB family radical SAM enzyme
VKRPLRHFAYVDEAGRLVLPAEVVGRLSLTAGEQVVLEEHQDALTLLPPVTALRRIYVELTNQCNLTCTTCMRNVWDEPAGWMSRTTFERLLDGLREISPLPEVFFGGFGEPLAHPDALDMIKKVKELGTRVELITNGILLTEETSQRLIECGLDLLWVSIDGATPESYADVRLGDALPTVISNIRRLNMLRHRIVEFVYLSGKPELGIAFVAMRRNIADLPEVLRLGRRLEAKHFSITNVLPHTPELCDEILFSNILNNSDPQNYAELSPRVNLPRLDVNEATQRPLSEILGGDYLLNIAGGVINQNRNICPFVQRSSLSIRWDGVVSPCLPLLHTHVSYLNDRRRLSYAYAAGDLSQNTLKEIWHHPEYLALRRRLQLWEFSPCVYCNSCEMAEDNREDCFGNYLPACGGCLWAQGLIRCP